jgi:guanine deaminase
MASEDEPAIPPLTGLPLAIHGCFIHALGPGHVEILENSVLIVGSDGTIESFAKDVDESRINDVVVEAGYAPDVFPVKKLSRGQFVIPGFVDTHHHAPQWAQRGIGRGLALLDWLEKVTFAHEARFEDAEYARRMYTACVSGGINQGTTTASYYGSRHGEASRILADICLKQGQRAFVGKCNMNRNAPSWYCDPSAEDSIRETKELIAHVRQIDPESRLVKPILTPRFAISCDHELLAGLGEIARQNPDLHIQTHFNEAEQEMEVTKQLYPQFRNEAELYEHFGLLGPRTILAHCIFLEEEEMERVKTLGCGLAHCPIATATGGAFMMAPVREYLRRGIKVGLGTDVGGGFSSSILDAMRQAFIISKARDTLKEGHDSALTLHEGFFLATLGGAQVCGLDDKIGNFAVGKQLDALEIHTIDPESGGSLGIITPIEEEDSTEVILEKFLMTGDDRNIAKVYVRGRSIKET